MERRPTGEEEDEVAWAACRPGDVDRGQVLLFGGAGDTSANSGIGVLGEPGAVEAGPGACSSPPVRDTYLGLGDAQGMDGDVPSAVAVVRCIMSWCRLLGLEGPGRLRVGDPRPRTLVTSLGTD